MHSALKALSALLITGVIVAGIGFPMVQNNQGFFQFPFIPGLEEKARNIFFHVPMSWSATLAFIMSMIYGIQYLRKPNIEYDLRSVTSASIGMLLCVLATVTGAVWAKFNWGSFWNWDPREVSIFILLLIYGAYFVLRSAIDEEGKRAKLSSAYSIIAGVTVPFFIFIMPRLMGGLHPGSAGDESGSVPVKQLNMTGSMLVVFFTSLIGFTLLYFWMFEVKLRANRIEQQLKSQE